MNKFIEGLRTGLETATQDMGLFMQGVASAVTSNAPEIVELYDGLEVELSGAIVDPWKAAADEITKFGGADGLGIMNQWIAEGGVFPTFQSSATTSLTEPWAEGGKAITEFEGAVQKGMANIVSHVSSSVSNVTSQLKQISDAYSAINDTTVRAPAVGNGGRVVGGGSTPSSEDVKQLQQILNAAFHAKIAVDGKFGANTRIALINAKNVINDYYKKQIISPDGSYNADTRNVMAAFFDDVIDTIKQNAPSYYIGEGVKAYTEYRKKLPAAFHAKGTLGTKRDELAITDESWIGEEITLAAGKNGQLQYLKKGSAVMPADISANLVEWGKLNPNMMNVGGVPNLTMISNAVNKPEFNLSFEALVKADRIDEGTLPEIKKYVTQEINSLVKQMNYAIKGYSR